MTNLIVFLLACYGVTNIITSGKIFQWFRDLLKPVPTLCYWVNCPMCVGFPVGMFWATFGLNPAAEINYWLSLLAAGYVSSGWCWMTRVVLNKLGEDEL